MVANHARIFCLLGSDLLPEENGRSGKTRGIPTNEVSHPELLGSIAYKSNGGELGFHFDLCLLGATNCHHLHLL